MVHAFLSDFLQNRICCTSQCPEQCFYGHELDLPLPLLSRGPQTSDGKGVALRKSLDLSGICIIYKSPEQCFYGHELDLPLPLLSRGPQTSHGKSVALVSNLVLDG